LPFRYRGSRHESAVAQLFSLGGCVTMSDIPKHNSWVRFPAAIIVAFVASVATIFIYAFIGVSTGMTSDSSPVLSAVLPASFNFLAGFTGVFFGSLCLRRSDRLVGSAGLLALGLCFEVLMLGSAHGEFHFPLGAIATGIGGLSVVGFYFWRKCQLPNDAA
jgi:hypothetical protein